MYFLLYAIKDPLIDWLHALRSNLVAWQEFDKFLMYYTLIIFLF